MTQVQHTCAALRRRTDAVALTASVWMVVMWTCGAPSPSDVAVLAVGSAVVLAVGAVVAGTALAAADRGRLVRLLVTGTDDARRCPRDDDATLGSVRGAPVLPGAVRARAPGRPR